MKVVNHMEFKKFLAYAKRRHLRVMEVSEKLNIILLQGRLRNGHFLLIEKERSRGPRKDNAAATDRVVQLLNRKRDFSYHHG